MASLEEIYGTGSPFKLPSSPIDTQRPGAILAQGLSQLPLMYLMLQQQKGEQARQDTLIGLKEDALNQEFNIATMENETRKKKIDQDWDINMYKGDMQILGYMSEYLSPEYMEQFLVGTRDNMKTTEGKALLNKEIGVSTAAQPGFDAVQRLKEIDHIGIADMETANEAYELSKIAPGAGDYYNDNIKKKVEKFKVTQANVTGFTALLPLLNDNQQTLVTGMLVNPYTSPAMVQNYINTSLTQNIQSKASDRQASRDLLGNIDTLIKSREAEYKTYTDENLRQGRYLQILEETKTIDNPDGDAQVAAEKLATEEGALATSISGLRGVLNTALEQGIGFPPPDEPSNNKDNVDKYIREQYQKSGSKLSLQEWGLGNSDMLQKGINELLKVEPDVGAAEKLGEEARSMAAPLVVSETEKAQYDKLNKDIWDARSELGGLQQKLRKGYDVDKSRIAELKVNIKDSLTKRNILIPKVRRESIIKESTVTSERINSLAIEILEDTELPKTKQNVEAARNEAAKQLSPAPTSQYGEREGYMPGTRPSYDMYGRVQR